MKLAIDSLLMRILLGPIVAALQLFAFYVVVHGHYSPGGGFQAGVLLAASMILPLLVHGERADDLGYITLSLGGALALGALGVLIYAAIGLVAVFFQQPILDYATLPLPVPPADRRSLGILGIELGVTLGVAGAIMAIFRTLQAADLPDEEDPQQEVRP